MPRVVGSTQDLRIVTAQEWEGEKEEKLPLFAQNDVYYWTYSSLFKLDQIKRSVSRIHWGETVSVYRVIA